MAAATALNVVKQIQALAEGPKSQEMRDCLGQVVSALLFFLDHPDSRVRLGAARTLARLSRSYRQDMEAMDPSRARSALARCRSAMAEGTADADVEELAQLVGELLGEASGTMGSSAASSGAEAFSPPASRLWRPGATGSAAVPACAATPSGAADREDKRGEVVLNVGSSGEVKVKAAILEKLVALAGVVSVTFEGEFVIVSTRAQDAAADAGFLADVLAVVKEQGLEKVTIVGAAVDRAGSAAKDPLLPAAEGAAAGGQEGEQEPAYLDDDEDETSVGTPSMLDTGARGSAGRPPGGTAMGGQPHWSFFSQSTWMTGRRLQEFGDDPTIAARLAKAKRREEERRQEEQTRLGRLSSWFTGR